ncbi:MAG: tetratricopeptide repeat protein, partial [Candidatus Methylomirabilales bacterium]
MGDPAGLEQAEFFFQEGYRHQMSGDVDAAVESYRRSIELYPTAEAHTFLGWAYSFQGKIDEAIRECE